MPKKKTYEQLLTEAQGFIKRDVETKLKISKVLYEMNQLKKQGEIARDLGWRQTDVNQHIRVHKVWGDRRIPQGWVKQGEWARQPTWDNYVWATQTRLIEDERNRYIEACLEHGPDGARDMRTRLRNEIDENAQRRYAEDQQRLRLERDARRTKMSPAELQKESEKYNLIYAQWLDKHLREVIKTHAPKIETKHITEESRTILDKLYDDLVVEFARLGIVELPRYLRSVS